jgi:hypothetical protein
MKRIMFFLITFSVLVMAQTQADTTETMACVDTNFTQPRFTVLQIEHDSEIYNYVIYARRKSIEKEWTWPEFTELRFFDFGTGERVVLRLDSSTQYKLFQYYEYQKAMARWEKEQSHPQSVTGWLWVWGK